MSSGLKIIKRSDVREVWSTAEASGLEDVFYSGLREEYGCPPGLRRGSASCQYSGQGGETFNCYDCWRRWADMGDDEEERMEAEAEWVFTGCSLGTPGFLDPGPLYTYHQCTSCFREMRCSPDMPPPVTCPFCGAHMKNGIQSNEK